MSVEEIEKLVTVLGSFGFGAILSGGIVFYFIKSYIPSYLSKKAENLATKEDIAGITREVESVKIGYAAVLEEVKTNNQLRLDSIGREQSIKKEVYMEAVEAITRSQGMISNFANLNISEEQITSAFSSEAGKIAKVQIVGSSETVNAITTLMGEIGTATLDLMLKRSVLVQRKFSIELAEKYRDKSQSEIDRYISIMKELNLTGKGDEGTWSVLKSSFESECKERDKYNEEIDKLWSIQNREHLEYVRYCMSTFFDVSELLPSAVLSVRKELDLAISHEDYLDIFNKNLDKGRVVFDKFLGQFEAGNA
ncbi:chromosome segregation ATPase [Vibrio rumoiensis]|uniref:chromosome segregation ATPase n=1 Tax=Vibrio rumoiensis TaxID=76258 RepID=UPI000B5CD14B|nr:chromosome segregation ATPase [Vibrio rumoiensis]